MVLPEALLIDREGAAHQRFGLGEPVGGLEQRRQVVEAHGDVGVVLPEALLIDGEGAAHQRFGLGEPVGGLKQLSQVVEALATLGWSVPKLCSSMARARRISGSASASRLVAWSNCSQVVEVGGDVGVVCAEALLIDGEGAAHKRFGLGQPVGGLEQLSQVVEV